MDKETIKEELADKSNGILAKYGENDIVDDISVMNMSSKTVFLGSLRVFNEDNAGKIVKDLNAELKGYGKLTVRDQKVVPCCAPSYIHISFNITIVN